jgi:hypothetical protein
MGFGYPQVETSQYKTHTSERFDYEILGMVIKESGNRIRLWFLMPGETMWEIGHTIDHGSMPARDAAGIMRKFLMGDIDVAEYRKAFV